LKLQSKLNSSELNTNTLLQEIEELKSQLFEANSIIEAIKEGSVDALVLNKDGRAHVYSIESADYTYRILIEKFGEGALSISDKGLILYCNDYFSKLLGRSANRITGTYIQSYIDEPAEFDVLLHQTLGDGPCKGEVTLNADDRKIHVYMSLTDLHPNVAAVGVVVTDLTEKQKQEELLVSHQRLLEGKVNELYETNKNLEQFIHVISHDLKEPVRKIATYSSHLSGSASDSLTAKEIHNLDIINSAALRLNSLVDDLVKYAFIATNAEESVVNLNEVIEEVTEDLELLLEEHNAFIDIGELPSISGSRVQMRQLFSNLIVNAVKYGKEEVDPIIRITSEIADAPEPLKNVKRYHKILVSDNGIGMEKEHLTKIFTIFQRLHLRDQYSGNGIGLAICKKVMENHYGKIDVESSAEGSTFILYFPIND
jgi:PAS domain S-box-containing protein